LRTGSIGFRQRTIVELGMVAVVTSQLWYHTFIDASLADIPGGWQQPPAISPARRAASR
jgi:hypothetical protein